MTAAATQGNAVRYRPAAFFAAVCFFLFVLAGCTKSSYRMVGSLEVHSGHEIRMSYSLFDGNRNYTLNLKEDSAIRVDVSTERGELQIEIAADGQEPVYTGRITENSSFTVYADAGHYSIRLSADHHAGSFCFDWDHRES